MADLEVGQKAPNVTLRSMDDEKVELADTWANGRHALLIFLRHLN